jgi:thymidylate kinase
MFPGFASAYALSQILTDVAHVLLLLLAIGGEAQVFMIIDIDGPSAVGKTTLITKLKKNRIGKGLPEVLETAKPPVKKPASAEQFLMKQLWFFEQAAKRYEAIDQEDGLFFVDIGILDVLLHTKYYPLIQQNNWNVLQEFCETIESRFKDLHTADLILYLTAKPETLRFRMINDPGTSRTSHEENLALFPYKQRFYEELKNRYPLSVEIIDAEPDLDEVYKKAEEVIRKQLYRHERSPSLPEILKLLRETS